MLKVATSLEELDHFQIFRSGLELGDWVWCLHCERVFRYGEYREESAPAGLARVGMEVLQLCPYGECDGSPLDVWPWAVVRRANPGYPEVPERKRAYPLYGSRRGSRRPLAGSL